MKRTVREKNLKLPCSVVSTISGEDVLYYEIEGDSLKKNLI